MSVDLQDGTIHLIGACRVDDAEPLAALLSEDRERSVNMQKCTLLHTAVFQALLAFAPRIVIPASNPLIYDLLMHLSVGARGASADER